MSSPTAPADDALAILFTLPVAFHCIFILGFQTNSPRVLAHSIVGSFVYGVICVKLLIVHSRRYPNWALPLAGGTLRRARDALVDVRGLVFHQRPLRPLGSGAV